jgi:hypothetical protein
MMGLGSIFTLILIKGGDPFHAFLIPILDTSGAKDFKGQLTNAAPGLLFAVAGLFIIGVSAWRGAPLNLTPRRLMANVAGGGDPDKQAVPKKTR